MRRRSPVSVFLLFVVALLLVETAWMLSVSPFGAIDELEHAQRADAVAAGEWRATGSDVLVDRDFNAAVIPVCESLPRATLGCGPLSAAPSGERVRVYTTAAAYNPVFYWVVGTAARPFEGYHELYAMRVAGMVLNALLGAGAFTIALLCFRSRWPLVGAVLTLTPMATFGGMVVAPNGLEASAALLVWFAVLAGFFGTAAARSRWVIFAAASGGILLGLLRTLGPFWLVGIIGVVCLAGIVLRRDRAMVRGRLLRPAWICCAVGWLVSCVAGLTWSLASGTNQISAYDGSTVGSSSHGSREGSLLLRPLVWVLQTVGAIPYRDQPLPLGIYAIALVLWATFILVSARACTTSIQLAAGVVAAVSLALPLTFAIVTAQGGIWQGRYGWPLSMGVFLLLAVGVDRRGIFAARSADLAFIWAVLGASALVVAASQVHVVHGERATSPLAHSVAWWSAPDLAIVVLTVAAFALIAWPLAARSASPR